VLLALYFSAELYSLIVGSVMVFYLLNIYRLLIYKIKVIAFPLL